MKLQGFNRLLSALARPSAGLKLKPSNVLRLRRPVPLFAAVAVVAVLASLGLRSLASSNGLVASYSFNEGTGTVLNDTSGNNNNGTIKGATWSNSGKFGKALSFNASNGSNIVTINDSASLHLTTGMTIEAWVNPNVLGKTGSVWKTVAVKEQTSQLAYGLYANSSPNGFGDGTITTGTNTEKDAYATSQLPLNAWSYLSATYDGTNLRYYANGNLVATTSAPGPIVSSTKPLRIGGNTIWSEWFGGLIDEIRIYNRALSLSEIQTDMTTPVSATPDTTPPTAPSSLAVSNITTTGAKLSWNASTDNVGVAGYNVYLDTTKKVSQTTTSYSFTGLVCGTSYTLGVEAYDAAGNISTRTSTNATTSTCPDTTAPSTPGGLGVTASSMTSINLSWSASTDNVAVTGYGLYQNGVLLGSTTSTSNNFTGLACGTPYTFGIDAFDAAGNRSAQGGYIASTDPCDTTAPSTPANLSASSTTETSISFQWDSSTDNIAVTGYRVYFDGVLQGNTTVTTYSASNLTCGTPHNFAVDAFDAAGNHSTPASLQTATLVCPPDTTPPTAPSSLSLSNITTTNASLSWSASSDNVGVTGYNLYQDSNLVGSTTTTSYSFTGLACGTSYALGVEAYDAAGNLSAQASIPLTTADCPDLTPPSDPTGLTLVSSTMIGLSVSWTASTDNLVVTGYGLYVNAVLSGTATTTNASFSGLTCGTSYTIGVDAFDAAGNRSGQASLVAATQNCDTTPPTINITSPAAGSSLSGSVTISVNVSDDVAVAGVQYQLDGVNLGSEILNSPYSFSWNTLQVANGNHVLTAVARDSSNNRTTSTSVNVTVNNVVITTPIIIPSATTNGITVGGGFVEASARQIVRTVSNSVYIVVPDDNVCQNGGSGVIRAYKGIGAQAANPNVPTGFTEVDTAHHPVSAGNAACQFAGGSNSVLFGPEIRLDRAGTIHLAYIDTGGGNLYYQTFSTTTDTWGARVVIATGAQTLSGSGWPRGGQVVLNLDANDVPYVAFATSGTSNSIKTVNKVSGSWSAPLTIATGTNIMHPAMATSLDGTIHLAWLDNSLAAHSVIKYSRYNGSWSTVETVSAGDAVVLANGDDDQGPSIATDSQNRPHVLYMDGTVNGTNNFVRMRYRTTAGVWTDNTPPGGAGGASNPAGTWYAHTPQNYISSIDTDFVFLGHDVNISPGGYQYQTAGPGNNWSAYTKLDPRNQTNVTAGAPGLDGSASIRWDPMRDNNPGLIDLIYYDENDGTAGFPHHATVYYKAIQIK